MSTFLVSAFLGACLGLGFTYLRFRTLYTGEANRVTKRDRSQRSDPEFPDGVDFGTVVGNCPVQGWGSVDGEEFYFRARGDQWSFTVGDDAAPIYELTGDYGERYDAGWMSADVAHGLIRASISAFRSSKRAQSPNTQTGTQP